MENKFNLNEINRSTIDTLKKYNFVEKLEKAINNSSIITVDFDDLKKVVNHGSVVKLIDQKYNHYDKINFVNISNKKASKAIISIGSNGKKGSIRMQDLSEIVENINESFGSVDCLCSTFIDKSLDDSDLSIIGVFVE